MTNEEVLDVFRTCDALLEGHFVLRSGRHSAHYLNKALVMQYPRTARPLCSALADKVRYAFEGDIDVVVSPAVGGIIPGFLTAHFLCARFVYMERASDGAGFRLGRGFQIKPNERVLLVEDVVTTGRTALECLAALPNGAVGAACLVHRPPSGQTPPLGPSILVALATVDFPSWGADEVPDWLAAIPVSDVNHK